MSEEKFAGQMAAIYRQGLKDFHNAVIPAFPQSQHSVDEPGTPLAPTQQMVTDDVSAEYHKTMARYSSAEREGQGRQQDQGIER